MATSEAGEGVRARPGVEWDDSAMRTTYANVCNVNGTREEVVVVFGTNQGWKGAGQPVTVRLSDRMILSPYAAKRLARLLVAAVENYEDRFGELEIERPATRRG